MREAFQRWGRRTARVLDRWGVIDESRLRPTVDLAWPRVITGLALMSKQTADVAMVGLVLGPSAIAGLAFAYAYWQIVVFLALGLAGGTIALVSQHYGAGSYDRAELAIEASLLVSVALAVPLTAGYALGAEPLVGLLSSDPDAIGYGATYLAVLAPAVIFEFGNMIASRTYAGIGDTFTPMVIRVAGGLLNIALNAVFIFALGLGVVGAALGTGISLALVALLFAWGMSGRAYPGGKPLPVGISWSSPHVDRSLVRQLLRISTPLIARRLAETLVVFPFLAIAGAFGTGVVAAFEIGRRVRSLIDSLGWGFSIAASTLVGQHLGRGEEGEAGAYGHEIIRLSLLTYVALAAVVIALATPIARLFTSDPATVDLAATFVRIAAVAVVGLGIDGSATGALRGAGDTRWPFYATLGGLYLCALPVAAVGVVTSAGLPAFYLALIVETAVPAAINLYRFGTDRWKAVSRSFRPTRGD